MSYQLTIITPGGKIFDDQIDALAAPGLMGGFGVLSGHVPMVAALKKGVLKLSGPSREEFLVIDQGILEVNFEHNVLILCDDAQSASNKEDAQNRSFSAENS